MSRRRTRDRSSGLRTAAVVVVLAGAVGSVGFLLRATDRNPSRLLVVLLALWVVSPFVALLSANRAATQWSVLTRMTLYGVMLVVTLSALAIYTANAVWPRTSQGAFVFVVVPPASWLLMAIVVPMAAYISARRPRGTRPHERSQQPSRRLGVRSPAPRPPRRSKPHPPGRGAQPPDRP